MQTIATFAAAALIGIGLRQIVETIIDVTRDLARWMRGQQ